MNKNIIMVIILMLVTGGAAFFGGMKYQQGKVPRMGQFGRNENSLNNRNQVVISQNRIRNGQIVGEIISVDEKTMTVKMVDGSSKIVLLNDSTLVSKSTEAQRGELKSGVKVAVFGNPNTDGSITGKNIELEPKFLGQVMGR